MASRYKLRYLPLFEQDMAAARDYIAQKLQNPTAAQRLVVETEQAILKRLDATLAFEPYRSSRDRKHPYYRIGIKTIQYFMLLSRM